MSRHILQYPNPEHIMSEVLRHRGEVAEVEIEIAISENTRKLPVRIWQHTRHKVRASFKRASLLRHSGGNRQRDADKAGGRGAGEARGEERREARRGKARGGIRCAGASGLLIR